MRIVDTKTFLAMPAGTVFAKYEPITFGELAIKGDTLRMMDFTYQSLIPSFVNTGGSNDYAGQLQAIEHGQIAPDLDFACEGRDGCFELDQLYAVFEPRDVHGIIERLQQALAACTPTPV